MTHLILTITFLILTMTHLIPTITFLIL